MPPVIDFGPGKGGGKKSESKKLRAGGKVDVNPLRFYGESGAKSDGKSSGGGDERESWIMRVEAARWKSNWAVLVDKFLCFFGVCGLNYHLKRSDSPRARSREKNNLLICIQTTQGIFVRFMNLYGAIISRLEFFELRNVKISKIPPKQRAFKDETLLSKE